MLPSFDDGFGLRDSNRLVREYRAAPMSHFWPEHVIGGKIILPYETLNEITRMDVVYPLIFKISMKGSNVFRYTSPADWGAQNGRVYIPDYMMNNLGISDGSLVTVELDELPSGEYAKFQPKTINFATDISNPRAVLEKELRNFAALTVGETIYFSYNNRDFYLEVIEVQPSYKNAICIIEANLSVNFEAPEGYVEPEVDSTKKDQEDSISLKDLDLDPVEVYSSDSEDLNATDSNANSLGLGVTLHGKRYLPSSATSSTDQLKSTPKRWISSDGFILKEGRSESNLDEKFSGKGIQLKTPRKSAE